MDRPPRSAGESIFAGGLLGKILFRGCLIGLTTLFVFSHFLTSGDLALARTAAFVTLVSCQLFHVFECRSERVSLWKMNPFGNIRLIGAVCVSVLVMAMSVWFPPLAAILETVPLKATDMLFILGSVLFAPVLSGIVDAAFRPHGESSSAPMRQARAGGLDKVG